MVDLGLRLAYLALVLGPIVVVLRGTVSREAWQVFSDGVPLGLLLRSCGLSAAVAVFVMAIAVPAASLVAERRRLWVIGWGCLALAAVAPYVHAQVWSGVARNVTLAAAELGLELPPFMGPAAALWVEASAALPLALGLAFVAIRTVPQDALDAGRMIANGPRVFARILVPMAAPVLVACASLVFLLSLLDFSIPTLYQTDVYALAVFAKYASSGQAEDALVFALPVLVAASLAAYAGQRALRAVPAVAPIAGATPTRLDLPPVMSAARIVALSAALLLIAVPILSLASRLGNPSAVGTGIASAREEAAFSFRTAVLAAALTLPVATAVGRRLAQPRAGFWWLAVALPLAVPAPLVAIGLLQMWLPFAHGPYGTSAMPVLAAVARFAPLAALLAYTQARRIDPTLRDAALVHQTSVLRGWWSALLPMWAPGLAAAAAIVFVLTLGELGATLLVVPPGHETLTLKTFNYLHYGASETVAELALLSGGVAVAGGIAAVLLYRSLRTLDN